MLLKYLFKKSSPELLAGRIHTVVNKLISHSMFKEYKVFESLIVLALLQVDTI